MTFAFGRGQPATPRVGAKPTLKHNRLVTGLDIHVDVMRRNADITNGLIVSEAAMMQLFRQHRTPLCAPTLI